MMKRSSSTTGRSIQTLLNLSTTLTDTTYLRFSSGGPARDPVVDNSMTDVMFQLLRNQVLASLSSDVTVALQGQPEWIPLEQTADGWFFLCEDRTVVHVDVRGAKAMVPIPQATALVGKIALRLPIAMWFLPRAASAEVCTGCDGSGVISSLPVQLRESVACRCGGLGWTVTS
jgi:hypothetical protein